MHIRFFTTLVIATTFIGCAVSTDPIDVEPEAAESEEALSFRSPELVGAYNLADTFTGDFTHLVLKEDGTFFTEQEIVCIRAPCINPRMNGRWSSTRATPTRLMTLTLRPVGQRRMVYYVSIAGDNTSMKLAHTPTESAALYERVRTFCTSVRDCDGQPVPALRMMCRVGDTMQTFCEASTSACISRCAPRPECNVDSDCRLFDDYCTGCDCRSLTRSSRNPVCTGPGVRCKQAPCGGLRATCDAGKCTTR